MKTFKIFALIFLQGIIVTNLCAQQGSMDWTCATPSAGWSARSRQTSVVFNNMMWIIGGTGVGNDVWCSSDGINWTLVNGAAPWSGRTNHTSVVFDNRMWVIGGQSGSMNYKNDVWFSYNGVDWDCATPSAPWSGRAWHTSVVFDGKIWVIGGWGPTQPCYYHDVWYSSDGVNWSRATDAAQWSGRMGHSSVVFDNKIWVFGGMFGNGSVHNDVWYSSNGTDWTCATPSAGWSIRIVHASVVFDNRMWVIGGGDGAGNYKNDVWYSVDGINWVCATTSAGWVKRANHSSIIFNNKIWIIGGSRPGGYQNDVWYSRNIQFALISPNGNEDWPGGSNQIIRWRTFGTDFFCYRLLFSRNSSFSYPDTIASNILPSETTYNWTVPLINSTTCRILLQMLNVNCSVIGQDVSDTNFTIKTLNIISPNGGEVWDGGSNQAISWWKTPYINFLCCRLYLSRNGGTSYPEIIANNIPSTDTIYNWNVPSINFTTCRIMVQMLDSLESIVSQDSSNSNFTIRTAPTIVSPNGGDTWIGGSNHIIKWRTVGTGFAGYRLLLSRNSGSSYPDTIVHYTQPSETTYNWTIPLINYNSCRVMVQILDAFGLVISQDASDGNFSIRTNVTVVFPNGGETLSGGSHPIIRWRTVGTGFARFRILLSRNYYMFNDTIVQNVSSTESTYIWIVPTINSTRCAIMVQMIDSSSSIVSYDYSNGFFTIITTGIEEDAVIDANCDMLRVIPCIVKSQAMIYFTQPMNSIITLSLYDKSGRLVNTLIDNEIEKGTYRVLLNTKYLSSGVYFIYLKSGGNTIIKKFLKV